ncbi:hypothetical protein EDB80DRAFT_266038 [Ilyonectria destructans]|nr:hypothetical protein EDB80DRAFT_266038 [Ilyonectria destructans]
MDIQPGPSSCPDGLTALNGYDLQDTAGNGLDFHGPALPAYFQWETLEPANWPTFPGLLQHQGNLAAPWGQHSSQSNKILASLNWEARSRPNAHIPMAETHTPSQDINQTASNWPSPPPSHTPERPQPPAKNAVRKRKTSSAMLTSAASGGDHKQNTAHKRVQERNRIAASKFRHRRHEEMEKLYSSEQDLEKLNFKLTSCLRDLVAEAQQLKINLLQHSTCECTLIHKYIQNEAQRYVKRIEKNSSLSDAEFAPKSCSMQHLHR